MMTHIPGTGFGSPEEAEAAFYEAFQTGRIEAMMQVWADAEDIVCIHPLGSRAVGRAEIEANWAEILGNGARLRFRIDGVRQFQAPGLVVRLVQEHIHFTDRDTPRPPILATNAYRLTETGWFMVLHHAAPQMREQPHQDEPSGTLH